MGALLNSKGCLFFFIHLSERYGESWTIQSNATGTNFARQHQQIKLLTKTCFRLEVNLRKWNLSMKSKDKAWGKKYNFLLFCGYPELQTWNIKSWVWSCIWAVGYWRLTFSHTFIFAFVTQLHKWHAKKKETFQRLHVGLYEQEILHVIWSLICFIAHL